MIGEPRTAIWAVVPVKGFARGKSRLGGVLSAGVRSAFARGLCEHVIATLTGVPAIAGTLVVTDDDEVAACAAPWGVSVMRDPEGATLAAAVDAGLAQVAGQGARAAFVCMADLPHLTAADVEAVVVQLADHDVVLTPNLARDGTNALCLAPPDGMLSCFGYKDSFVQHLARAHAAALRVQIVERHGLCFDVDDPGDFDKISRGAP